MAGKVIITCALTGSGHTPSMSPYLPYTVGDVVDQGVAAAEAGAAGLPPPGRNPEDGSPAAPPGRFAQGGRGVKERSDVGRGAAPERGSRMRGEGRRHGERD